MSRFHYQAPIGSLPSPGRLAVFDTPPSRADRSTQRHSVASRNKSQTRPNDPTIIHHNRSSLRRFPLMELARSRGLVG